MEIIINWETSLEKAQKRSKTFAKPILLDCFNQQCSGCQLMNALTYTDEEVCNFINMNVVPLRIPSDHVLFATDYIIQRTPTLVILDQTANEQHRTVGFIGIVELIPSLLLGIGNVHLNNNEFQEAISSYKKIVTQYPKSSFVRDAIFQIGVCRYKTTSESTPHTEANKTMINEASSSCWI